MAYDKVKFRDFNGLHKTEHIKEFNAKNQDFYENNYEKNWVARIIYSTAHKSTIKNDEFYKKPIVEFYCLYNDGDGFFVSSYYIETLLENYVPGALRTKNALGLQGSQDKLSFDPFFFQEILEWLATVNIEADDDILKQ